MRSMSMTMKPSYSVEIVNGVVQRSVAPYVQEFETFAKGRWLGRQLIEVLCTEFGGHPPIYWTNAIRRGLVKINGQAVTETYKFKNSDRFLHRTHRHEPPVFGTVEFVDETDTLFAVSKPSSMPMHPSGAYRFNTLENILRYEPFTESQPPLYLVHRLDRVTSGLVVLAKDKITANAVSEVIRTKSARKIYLARVKGRFPQRLQQLRVATDTSKEVIDENDDDQDEEENEKGTSNKSTGKRKRTDIVTDTTVIAQSFEELCQAEQVSHRVTSFTLENGQSINSWTVHCPIGVISFRDGIHTCHSQGKASVSSFISAGYCPDSDSSLVVCLPLTGRTHQLRLHLELCGNPIANDPCYGGELFYGEPEKRRTAIDAIRQMKISGFHPLSKLPHLDSLLTQEIDAKQLEQTTSTQSKNECFERMVDLGPQREGESDDDYLMRHCRYCTVDKEAAVLEQSLHCDGIWLHALQYSSADWKFRSKIPHWAMTFSKEIDDIMNHVDSQKGISLH